MPRTPSILAVAALFLFTIAGCMARPEEEVVVYTALDEGFSRPIFERFEDETGVTVRPKFDTESTKTVGLVEAIIAERQRPRCDVFWNNEILHTLRLQKLGLLEVYHPPIAEKYPEQFRSPEGLWHGFAARARVLIVNTEKVERENWPRSIHDLADPQWKSGIAKPLFGTTATHAACLFAYWGEEEAKAFFRKLKGNVQIMAGNKQVALAVAGGSLEVGITDTDDAIIEKEQGLPIEIIYPDQGEDEIGTLFIPNTLAILRGSPNPKAARKLVDYLLSAEVERTLALGASAQIPLNPEVEADVRVETPRTIMAMQADFAAAADAWETASQFIRDEFTAD